METWHPLLFRNPSQKSEKFPSSVPGFCQISALIQSVTRLLALLGPQFCILSLAHGWDSEIQILKDPFRVWNCFPPTEDRLAMLHLVLFCPSKAVAWLRRCLEFIVKHSNNQVICSLCDLCPLLLVSYSVTTVKSFVLGDTVCPFPNVLQKGKCSLPLYAGNPYTMLFTLRPLPSSPGAPLHSPAQLW